MIGKSPTRRTLLASVAGAGLIGLAGCTDGGGTNGDNAGDGGSSDGSGSDDGGGGEGGGSSNSSGAQVQGLESVNLSGKTLTVRRVEDSNVDGIRLYDPNNKAVVKGDEQLVSGLTGGDFNNVQRELELQLREGAAGWPAGEWTIETYAQGGSTIDTGTITFTREFAVTGATYQSPGGDAKGDEKLLFEVESTGDLPVRIQSIAVLETTNGDRLGRPTPTAEGLDIRGPPGTDPRLVWTGQPKEVYIGGEFTFISDGELADSPCAGMQLERTYELTAKTGESATADVTLEFGEGVQKDAITNKYWCTNGEVVEFSGDPDG